ncbi:MAG TPA: SDR family oxidoreductase [Bacteroidales bacterium]|nr:SDR family oxidoreductase [Bacteroidales bacterium]
MKTVVITGGTRGIGAVMVHSFLIKGWRVIFCGSTEESVHEARKELMGRFSDEKYLLVQCDVSKQEDVEKLWYEAIRVSGRVDIWVNNAGMTNERASFNELMLKKIKRVIDTNLTGLMMTTHIVYNRMKEQGRGAIYNMEGLGSDGRTVPGLVPYGTTKRAVRYFTDAFAKEVENGPVIVGTISPGMVMTDMLLDPLKKHPEKNKDAAKIYNILADEPETVAPWLVDQMINNKKNGAKIAWLTRAKAFKRFALSPFRRRDIVSKYL